MHCFLKTSNLTVLPYQQCILAEIFLYRNQAELTECRKLEQTLAQAITGALLMGGR
jgi:hypothetical protein